MHVSHRGRFPNDLTNQVTRDGHDPVASGGFADIYRGMLQDNGRSIKVAIKAIKTYSGEDDKISKKQKASIRLRREIKVWLDLRHDNVLSLLGTTMGFGRFPAMVCPWVENGALTSYLDDRHGSLSVVEILGLLNNVASGLQYLHSRSVVHGDLSGSNVLIHENGKACIADFGLSMLLTELGASTFATSFHARGTLRWTAPELLDLEVPEDDVDDDSPRVSATTQSDVYSFGSIMLQILSGKVPYHYYRREAQVLHAISKGKTPRRPSCTFITERRWMFIQRCWSPVDTCRPLSKNIVEFAEGELTDHKPREMGMPMPPEDVDDARPRTHVLVESTATPLQPPPDEIRVPVPHPPRPPRFYRRPREIVTPNDIVDPWPRTRIPVGSTATRPHPPPDDFRSNPARLPLEDLRQRFRQRSRSTNSIPNIIVQSPSEPETTGPESPSEPDTTISPTAIMTQPELLSPEAANRPLPQDDADIDQHLRTGATEPKTVRLELDTPSVNPGFDYQLLQLPDSSNDTVRTRWVFSSPWRPGIIPPTGNGLTSTSNVKSNPQGDYHRTHSNPSSNPKPNPDLDRSQNGYVRTRTQNASTSMGSTVRVGSTQEAVAYPAYPAPPGVKHSPPSVRPDHKSRGRTRDREWVQKLRNARLDEMIPPPAPLQRPIPLCDSDEELTRSPGPLQRPISLFDSESDEVIDEELTRSPALLQRPFYDADEAFWLYRRGVRSQEQRGRAERG